MSKKPSAGGKIQWTKMFRKLSPYTIRKGFRYMKHYGPKEFWIRLHERFEPEEVPYGPWYRAYIPTEETLETQRKQKFDYSPLISIALPSTFAVKSGLLVLAFFRNATPSLSSSAV